jgi:UDP-GlcNAc:undecaprenyl-phosphate GlcNAc-1-phosphate transferase
MNELDALYAFLVAAALAAAVTPVASRLAVRVGAVDEPSDRGLSDRPMPRLGGLAILVAVLVAGALFLPDDDETRSILAAAALITIIGAIDDAIELPASVKLAGQFGAGLIPVLSGVRVDNVTLPFVGPLDFGADAGGALTLLGLVALMKVVNF